MHVTERCCGIVLHCELFWDSWVGKACLTAIHSILLEWFILIYRWTRSSVKEGTQQQQRNISLQGISSEVAESKKKYFAELKKLQVILETVKLQTGNSSTITILKRDLQVDTCRYWQSSCAKWVFNVSISPYHGTTSDHWRCCKLPNLSRYLPNRVSLHMQKSQIF